MENRAECDTRNVLQEHVVHQLKVRRSLQQGTIHQRDWDGGSCEAARLDNNLYNSC